MILAVALLFSASGCGDPLQRAADKALLAQSQLSSGNLDDARENAREAISARDDVADYYVLLARIEMAAQRPASAFNAYSMALDLQADNLEVLQNISELGLQTGNIREAREAADRILLLTPNSTRAMLVKGFIAIDDGRMDDAEQMVSKIQEINANDEGGIILSARVNAIKGDVDRALATVVNAIAEIGETEALNLTLLEVYRRKGDSQGMRKVFPTILESMPGSTDYLFDYVNLLYKTGEPAMARSEAIEAIQAKPNDLQLYQTLSTLWLEYDRKPLSNSQISYIAQSGTRAAQLSLARFYYAAGNYEAALRLSKIPFSAGVPEAQGLVARIRLAQGDAKTAGTLATKLLERDVRNADALLVRSALHRSARQFDRAIEDASLVVSDSPQEFAGYVELASAYAADGNLIRARQTFERGMDILPQSTMLADEYRDFLLRVGDTQRIVSLYHELALAKPSSAATWKAYAKMCSNFGGALCASKATSGMTRARMSLVIDEPPGTPQRRGLFARITPEEVCAASGGLCTEN
ncbi:tetratricopeptide repeat protein [Allopontixanthobacter sediminis]|uniref:Tetratricopeptide repeat protein n=1 Tax=Allopontixanthobacter sediminis TaxID=1689985 RepID=A0A845BAL5_9SPHN|nr:tetratricopeptide repeat protein [Allopontixanthobacter sediminis]MXP44629.1 tetratricopeptide repeat protein [Allopontixanthobacter sediminis]